MSGSAPGRREVAYRLFAAEFDDAEFSYSESDEERAPNYVVTPTGARVNRLFAVGVLTEVDDVNPEMVRGRVVDPTGAFVTYAGQYQPDALAFLERADPPTFVALSGKARTFEPDDDDVVYSSVRPESVNEVDAETRDRWVVTAADRTVERVGVVASAIEADLAGDQLRVALTEAGVDDRLADGVALALDFYDTTPAYLGALRETALDAARVVAGELDEVGRLDAAPDEVGGPEAATAAELATLDLSGAPSPATAAAAADAGESSDTDAGTDPDDGGESIEVSEPDRDVEAGSTGETSEPATGADTATEPEAAAETEATGEPETATAAETETTAEPEFSESDAGDGSPETASTEPESESEPTAESAPDEGEEPGEFEPGEFDLDEETRREVEEEYGTEFSTADEVEEADIETPDPESDPEAVDAETDAAAEPESEPEPEPADGEAAEESGEESAGEVDLEDAVMAAMERVGDDEGADREELVAAVVDEHGVDPEAVEDAIQEALMSGRCYEPADGTLKAI
jgi:RPA family protein